MRIGSALSTDPDPGKATAAAADEAGSQLGGAEVSLAVVVGSRHHAPSAEVVSEAVRVEASTERVIGCVAETVVGGDREVEDGPAVAVWLASLSSNWPFHPFERRTARARTRRSALEPDVKSAVCCSGSDASQLSAQRFGIQRTGKMTDADDRARD